MSLRRINLLPPEDRRRRRAGGGGGLPTGRRAILGGLLVAGALALISMTASYVFYEFRYRNERAQTEALDAEISRQNQRVAELAPYGDLQARLDAKKPIADGIYRTRFPWDEFMRGLAFVIPEDTALDTFSGTAAPVNVTAPPIEPPAVENLEPPGAITFTGVALPEYRNVADFVVRMNNLRFLANARLTNAELDRETYESDAINFEVSAELVTRVGDDDNEVPLDEPREPATGGGGEEGPTGQPLPEDQASRAEAEPQ